ncbi:MAG: hypothetical protein LBF40_06185 [Deltaproteobacteria bacterium]|jgi:hypothetical protein|nr:hypothetical protein [Deltaproteobacteria bacterium]
MSKWNYIFFGLGFLAGIGATAVLKGRGGFLRDKASSAMSYGIGAKRKIESIAGIAKENMADLLAESDEKERLRQKSKPVVVGPESN